MKKRRIDVVDDLHKIRRNHSAASPAEIELVAAEITDVLYGSVKVEKPIDDPKQVAREHIRKKLLDDLQ